MAVLTAAAFFSKYSSIFADNATRNISEEDMRDFAEDIKDSFQSIAGATAITSWKDPCVVATTANITLSGEQTIDGVLTSASRVLVKNQATTSQNGIYVSAAGAWSRATDADDASELEGAAVGVNQGTTNKNTIWLQTTDNVTLGTSAIAWQQVGYSSSVDVIDDDTFATATSSNVASAESTKAYVDAQVATPSVDTYSRIFEDYDVGPTGYFNLAAFNNGGGVGGTATLSSVGQDSTEKAIGVLELPTGTSTGGGSALVNTTYRHPLGCGATHTLIYRAAISALSDGTNTYTARLGFMNSHTTTASITYGAYFRYTHGTNAGKWEAVCVSGVSETAQDTGVSPSAASFSAFKIVVNDDATSVAFYIDGTLTNTITTNIPTATGTTNGQAATIEKTAGSTSRSLYVDYVEKIAQRTTAR